MPAESESEAPRPRRPRLRPVEAFPVTAESGRYVCLRDPSGLAPSPVFVPDPLLPIVALFDGERTTAEIRAELERENLGEIPLEKIDEVADALDRAFFLESPLLEAERKRVHAAFRAASSRAPAHAGGAYPAEPGALRSTLDGYFAGLAPEPGPARSRRRPFPRALLAPHIDFHRGGPAYAAAYRAFEGLEPPETFVVLGTWHASGERPFVLTEKDYETPLGAMACDRDFVRALAKRLPRAGLFDEEIGHRHEHSIEFQAVMLRRLFGDAPRPPLIVPILVGSMHQPFFDSGKAPGEDAEIGDFLAALRDVLAERAGRVSLVGGVDLAHVGPRFGDRDPLTSESLAFVEKEDRSMLDTVLGNDASAFFRSIAKDRDRRRVCGYPPIYSLLSVLDASARGRLLRYEQCTDKDGAQSVTIASVVFD